MEVKKRASAIAALCMLLLMLSAQQQQVAAMSKFCRCYKQCYPGCRQYQPRWLCVLSCADHCHINPGTNSCKMACSLISICGLSEVSTGKMTDHLDCIESAAFILLREQQ